MTLDELVTQLREGYGDALRAVVLYGSAVAGERIAKRSDYNVLVIVRDIPFDRLRPLAAVARAWKGDGNPPPMTFTEGEWRSSADVFPMEYADILERHRVLWGEPPFDGVQVDPADLRLQVEREALALLLRLRQAILVAGGDAEEQRRVLAGSLSAAMILFRAVSRLHGRLPPQNYVELARDVAALAGIDPAPLENVVQHARGERPVPKEDAAGLLQAYYGAMEAVARHVDALPPSRT